MTAQKVRPPQHNVFQQIDLVYTVCNAALFWPLFSIFGWSNGVQRVKPSGKRESPLPCRNFPINN